MNITGFNSFVRPAVSNYGTAKEKKQASFGGIVQNFEHNQAREFKIATENVGGEIVHTLISGGKPVKYLGENGYKDFSVAGRDAREATAKFANLLGNTEILFSADDYNTINKVINKKPLQEALNEAYQTGQDIDHSLYKLVTAAIKHNPANDGVFRPIVEALYVDPLAIIGSRFDMAA